ncbi:MAG: hypothetical protein GXX79_21835 [Actinomycetales bacterium]|nr:hypothetical protein [Actinomycetales bacterium]
MSAVVALATAATIAVTALAVRAARRDARSRAAQHAAYTTWQATGHGSRAWSWHWVWADTTPTPGHDLTTGTTPVERSRVVGVEVSDLDDSDEPEADARGARETRSPGHPALVVGRTVTGDVVTVFDHPHHRRGPLALARGVRVTHRVCGSPGCTRRGRYTFPSLATCPGCTGPMTAVRGWNQ